MILTSSGKEGEQERPISFSVVVPFRSEACKKALPQNGEEAVRFMRFLPTWATEVPGGVKFWWALPGCTEGRRRIGGVAWRVMLLARWDAMEHGISFSGIAEVELLSASAQNALPGLSSGCGYKLAEFEAQLDQYGVHTREEVERRNAIAARREIEEDPEWRPQIDPDATVPDHIFLAILEDPRLGDIWFRRCRDVKPNSEAYDLALAVFGMNAGWGKQEIVNAVIHARREHRRKPDLREKYFWRLLATANRKAEANGSAGAEASNPRAAPAQMTDPDLPSREHCGPARRRRQFSITLDNIEQATLERRAAAEGLSLVNWFRALAGLPPVFSGRPKRDEHEKWQDEKLMQANQLGLDSDDVVPDYQ